MIDMDDTRPLIQSCGAWKTKALDRHVALRLRYEQMLAWYDTVTEIVGPSWLQGQSALASSKTRTLADVHPLYRFLNEGTDTALIQICELGQYIDSFKSDPALPRIAQDLVSSKFQSTVFELAMAYRWRLAGGQITLQPPAARGRIGDFSAVLSEVPFIVETSNISTDLYEKISFRAPLLIRKAVPAALLNNSVLLVEVSFKATPTGTWDTIFADRSRSAAMLSAVRMTRPNRWRCRESARDIGSALSACSHLSLLTMKRVKRG